MTHGKRDAIAKGLACLLAGCALPLAFSPWALPFVAFLAPAVPAAVWLRASPKSAFACGYLFGLGMFGVGVSWLHISINLFGGVNFAGAVVLTALFTAFMALYPALTGYLSRRLFARAGPLAWLLLVLPAVWVLTEWIRGWLFTGFPWLNLGYSQIDTPLGGLAPPGGVYAVSLAVMLTAGALAAVLRLPVRAKLIAALAVLAVWAGAWLLQQQSWSLTPGRRIDVALVQGAVPQALKWRPDVRRRSMELYLDLTRPYLDSDLIVWPETSIPALYGEVRGYLDGLSGLAARHGSAILTGIPVHDAGSGRYYNSLLALNGRQAFYHKKHLVPFGEYIPFSGIIGGLLQFLHIPMSDFSPGPDVPPLLTVNGLHLGVSICYEDTFGEEIIEALPQADILVNVSNDAWFGDSAAPHQHLQMARMRALETGRYMLRATNTGVSALIDEKGGLVSTTREFEPAVLAGSAVLFSGLTPYARFGNYPIVLLALLLVCAGLLLQRHRKEVNSES